MSNAHKPTSQTQEVQTVAQQQKGYGFEIKKGCCLPLNHQLQTRGANQVIQIFVNVVPHCRTVTQQLPEECRWEASDIPAYGLKLKTISAFH